MIKPAGSLVKSHDVWEARMALSERGTWQLRQIDNGAADQAFCELRGVPGAVSGSAFVEDLGYRR